MPEQLWFQKPRDRKALRKKWRQSCKRTITGCSKELAEESEDEWMVSGPGKVIAPLARPDFVFLTTCRSGLDCTSIENQLQPRSWTYKRQFKRNRQDYQAGQSKFVALALLCSNPQD